MNQSVDRDLTHQLQQLMQQVGISSFNELSKQTGVSKRQLKHLRLGEVSQMRVETLVKISSLLQVSVTELLKTFSQVEIAEETDAQAAWKQEYERLQEQLRQQRESLMQEFQQTSLQVLESWLLQWPTAANAAKENPQLPAVRLLPLVRPVEQLVQQWGVEAIAFVGEEIPYNPQYHQLMEGSAQPGEQVRVRYTGYRQAEKLLFRAKVSPLTIKN
ncbi:helix-turn-helix domain protein [Crinalium epipsammum PCC 9333]|uniref:Helix-turn-helix domain protein n=1 Tax=Crinalium epipsammum PCC 9333 TaxID=1173022 RepID=K9VT65_9CYAN|nr:helix-turn-helix transcriptional regulator [Crinalium epipsammum]AFZ11111.1 helix-turn-helix domain protein [Crinalium epipsammum PCC 9333]